MICPECGEENSRVIDTRHATSENKIYRVRKCLCCGYPWATEEVIKAEFKKENISV